MIPNDQPARKNMIARMLNVLETDSDKMTKWEQDYIISLREQFGFKKNLSDKQCEILERIYDK